MDSQTNRISSDLPSGDPALLNRISWARRWSEPGPSREYALAARKKALDGHGRRSQAEEGFALRTLGWQAFWQGELTLSMDYCLQAENFLPEKKFAKERAGIYAVIGRVHCMRNRFDLANHSVERGLWLVKDMEETPAVLADLMLTQANIQQLTSERARAGITLGRVREICDEELLGLVELSTANLLLEDGDAAKGLEYAQSALATVEKGANMICLPFVRVSLAGCYLALSKTLDAHDQISQGLAGLTDGRDNLARCCLLRRRGALLMAKGDHSAAVAAFGEAGDIAEGQTNKLHGKQIALDCAEALEAQGDYRAAVAHHKKAWRLQSETRQR